MLNESKFLKESFSLSTISSELLEKLFNLTKKNMKEIYDNTNDSKWIDNEKWREFKEENPLYLCIFDKDDNNKLVAFCYYQITYEEDEKVIYCYELQVVKRYQNEGLGKFLMSELEKLSKELKLNIVLTVFKNNFVALNFYKSLGFEIHHSCPTMFRIPIMIMVIMQTFLVSLLILIIPLILSLISINESNSTGIRTSEEISRNLAQQLQSKQMDNALLNIDKYFLGVETFVTIVNITFLASETEFDNYDVLYRTFLKMHEKFAPIQAVYFAQESDKNFIGIKCLNYTDPLKNLVYMQSFTSSPTKPCRTCKPFNETKSKVIGYYPIDVFGTGYPTITNISTTSERIYDAFGRKWFINSSKYSKFNASLLWTDVYRSTSGELDITVSYPFFNKFGNLSGVFGVDITLDELSHSIRNMVGTPNGFVYILSQNGELIVSSGLEPIYNSFNNKSIRPSEMKNSYLKTTGLFLENLITGGNTSAVINYNLLNLEDNNTAIFEVNDIFFQVKKVPKRIPIMYLVNGGPREDYVGEIDTIQTKLENELQFSEMQTSCIVMIRNFAQLLDSKKFGVMGSGIGNSDKLSYQIGGSSSNGGVQPDKSQSYSEVGVHEALKLAVEDINKHLSDFNLAEVNFTLKYFNTNYSSAISVKQALAMKKEETAASPIIGVVGGFYSSHSKALSFATQSLYYILLSLLLFNDFRNLLQCSGSSTSPELKDKGTYSNFFRTVPNDNFQSVAMANYVYNNNWRRVAIINAQVFQATASELGITVVTQYIYSQAKPNYAEMAKAIKFSGARIIMMFAYEDLILYFREARKLGLLGPDYGKNTKYKLIITILVYIGSDGTWDMLEYLQLGKLAPPEGYVAEDWENLNGFFGFSPKDYSDTAVFNDVEPSDLSTPKMTLSNLFDKKFTSMSGEFSLDKNGEPIQTEYQVENYVGNLTRVIVSSIDGRTGILVPTDVKPLYFGGSDKVPLDSAGEMKVSLGDAGPLIIFIYFMLNLAITFASICYLIYKRDDPLVKRLSLPFLIVISIGLMLVWVSIFGYSGKMTETVCNFQTWSMWLAFSIVMGALLIKVYRIWKIFDNVKMERRNLSNTKMLLNTFLIVLIESVILICWQAIDPPIPQKIMKADFYYYDCLSSNKDNQLNFNVALIVYNGLLLLIVTYVAFKTRNIDSVYRESAWIAQLSMNITLCSSITVVIMFISENSLVSKFYIRMIAIGFSTSVTYFCLIGRIVLVLMMSNKGITVAKNTQSLINTGTTFKKSNVDKKGYQFENSVIIKEEGILTTWKKGQLFVHTGLPRMISIVSQTKKCGFTLILKDAIIENGAVEDSIKILCGRNFLIQCKDADQCNTLLAQLKDDTVGKDVEPRASAGQTGVASFGKASDAKV
ncbi:Gamma-aminobutyric acid type B receptor subunit 2 [Clydaea vesicula]|uniref:Gamma-aminobutyric acid type B receptor subunit 2 n=1 Tax=Clydaea vesicula TaxID=447962 RepID=A0AAD5U5L3_9FUNG|nr:Gamma-aminobutyric acid type B receptor subunit 2 [Clydaea vesicula]